MKNNKKIVIPIKNHRTIGDTQKTIQKSLTQLTVNHFFKPKNLGSPKKTLKRQQLAHQSSPILKIIRNDLGLPEKINSTSNDKYANILLNDFLKFQNDEKTKILSKSENLFIITQIKTNTHVNTTLAESLPLKFLNSPYKLLILSHHLYCKEVEFKVLLAGKWLSMIFNEGDLIEIFGNFDENCFLEISNTTPDKYLIYEPNIILYPTLILDSSKCIRKGVLSLNYVGKDSNPNLPLIIGCLAHELFEQCFKSYNEGIFIDKIYILKSYKELVKNYIESLYILRKSEKLLEEDFSKYIDYISEWFDFYLYQKKDWMFNEKTGETIKILRVIDTESMIVWSNMGIKGKLDAIFYCQITDKNLKTKNCFIPFELKSGKEYYLHFYQGFLYCLLLSHKFDQKFNLNPFFYYLNQNKALIKTGNDNDIVDLLLRRNALAYGVKHYESVMDIESLSLPKMLEKNTHECNMCYFNDICSSIDIAYNKDNIEDIGLEKENFNVYNSIKIQMTLEEKQYLKKWLNLLKMEENFEKGNFYSFKSSKISIKNSQKILNSAGNELVFELESIDKLKNILQEITSKSKHLDEKITLAFIKQIESSQNESLFNTYERLSMIDNATIRQPDSKIVFKAFIEYKKMYQREHISQLKVEIRVNLSEIMINLDKFNIYLELLDICPKFYIEKIDKTYYPSLRSNIFDLILSEENKDKKELLIYNKPNTFENHNVFEYTSFEKILNEYKSFNMNDDQIETIRKSLLADQFNLILGMPGTGKTHTLAILIKILWDLKFKVLISSYTHSALDNILGKLLDLFPETMSIVVRCGKSNNHNLSHNKFEKITYERNSFNTCEEIEKFFYGKTLAFVTTLSSGQSILRKF